MPTFLRRTAVAAPRDLLFAWHARQGAFERLTPPWERVELVEDSGGIADGARKVLAIGPLGLVRWTARHEGYVEGRQFRDVQERGPFRRWVHTHSFHDDGPGAAILEDRIEYELPLGRLGAFFGGALVHRKLERMFEHRHRVTRHDVELAAREPPQRRSLGVLPLDRGARNARCVRAFLSALGWELPDPTDEDVTIRPVLRVRVGPGSVHLETDGPVTEVALPDLSDASLARVHRALLRFQAQG